MLKPMLSMLEIAVPDAKAENNAALFMEDLIVSYIPEEMPKELIRKFTTDFCNKNEEQFNSLVRELYLKTLHYLNSVER